jgi:hypothetical protein
LLTGKSRCRRAVPSPPIMIIDSGDDRRGWDADGPARALAAGPGGRHHVTVTPSGWLPPVFHCIEAPGRARAAVASLSSRVKLRRPGPGAAPPPVPCRSRPGGSSARWPHCGTVPGGSVGAGNSGSLRVSRRRPGPRPKVGYRDSDPAVLA